jgi:hypothetical protein
LEVKLHLHTSINFERWSFSGWSFAQEGLVSSISSKQSGSLLTEWFQNSMPNSALRNLGLWDCAGFQVHHRNKDRHAFDRVGGPSGANPKCIASEMRLSKKLTSGR